MNVLGFGSRLEEERRRLGLKKGEMAQAGNVSASAYGNYLRGERVPDLAAAAAWATAGVDVLYVLTGEPSRASMSVEEVAVLTGYRSLDTRGRAGVLALISGMQDQSTANVRVKGDVGQYVEGDVTAPLTIDMRKRRK